MNDFSFKNVILAAQREANAKHLFAFTRGKQTFGLLCAALKQRGSTKVSSCAARIWIPFVRAPYGHANGMTVMGKAV